MALEKSPVLRLPGLHGKLVGREDELGRLDRAWQDGNNVISVVAWGGVGKTALAATWLARMAVGGYDGARYVFTWSFYSQGTENLAASADGFMDAALRFFGDDDPSAGTAWERGERLAGLVAAEKAVLVLDGMEPLQYPPGPMRGQLKDPGMKALVGGLCGHNAGLCVITTREILVDIGVWEQTTAPRMALGQLSDAAGAELLALRGVDGSERERREASQAFDGHALALNLLGSYLREVHHGDVRRYRDVPLLEGDDTQGRHARRVMDSYVDWLAANATDGPAMVGILSIMGLFDRPASKAEIQALREASGIAGLTDALDGVPATRWNRLVTRLRETHLLTEPVSGSAEDLDAHPLVREYFARRVRTRTPEAWQAGHERLFAYLQSAAPDLPDTLAEMAPLFAAITHGCLAGQYQRAHSEVLYRRILRGSDAFAAKQLGAFGALLGAMARFFDSPWDQPNQTLGVDAQAWLLGEAGFYLRALGRSREALEPMQAGLNARIAQEVCTEAALNAGNLSQLRANLGDLADAERLARQSVALAGQSGDVFQRMSKRATLANALYLRGQWSEARTLFAESEVLKAQHEPDYPHFYSLVGYLYCELLLAQAESVAHGWEAPPAADALADWASLPDAPPQPGTARDLALAGIREVQTRATWAVQIAEAQRWLLDIALDHVTLGRARLLEALLTSPEHTEPWADSARHLDQAVQGLRAAGTQHHLPRGLLARAALCRTELLSRDLPGADRDQRITRARADLDEAQAIAERAEFRLHLADVHLERARLALAIRDINAARDHRERAAALIDETGYHARDHELNALTQDIESHVMPLPERQWTPEQLCIAMRPRESAWRNVYVIGSYDRRITFYNQQVRALCLIAALHSTKRLQGKTLAVIGGGAAGCTAAMAACLAGAERVILYERRSLFQLQRLSNRYLHPHIYDWPDPGSRNPDAGLPVLNWHADEAKRVIDQLVPQVKHPNLDIRTATTRNNVVDDIEPKNDQVIIYHSKIDQDTVDLAIVAIGFGDDQPRHIPDLGERAAYWQNDSLDAMTGKTIVISGAGDGGLIDLARACFENFRHERILDLLAGFDRADELGDMLKQDNPPFRACKDLITPDLITRVQRACAGRDNKVYFNSQTRDLFKAESAPINRLLALLLCAAGQAEPVPGWLTVQRKDGKLITSIQQPSGRTEPIPADHVVARHGPRYTDSDGKPCRFIEKKFPRLAAQCKDLGGTLADLRITETLDRQTFQFFADLSAST